VFYGMNGSRSPSTTSLATPVWSMVTSRITPPDEPSRAIAWEMAVVTSWAGREREREEGQEGEGV
jgi:hypothetical protein